MRCLPSVPLLLLKPILCSMLWGLQQVAQLSVVLHSPCCVPRLP